MRTYQSESGEWIATDDQDHKARAATPAAAEAAFRAAWPDAAAAHDAALLERERQRKVAQARRLKGVVVT